MTINLESCRIICLALHRQEWIGSTGRQNAVVVVLDEKIGLHALSQGSYAECSYRLSTVHDDRNQSVKHTFHVTQV
jgi:hypothetical protein